MLNVYINTDSIRFPLTGIGQYTYNLCKELLKQESLNLFTYPVSIEQINSSQIITNQKTSLRSKLAQIPGSRKAFQVYQNRQHKLKTTKLKHFIYHEPVFLLKPFDGKKIVNIHDLSFLHYPDYHPKHRVELLKNYLPKTIKQATHIITGADIIKNEIQDYYKVPDDDVSVIQNGVDIELFNTPINSGILSEFALEENKYIFCLSTLEPRKNINRLIDAYLILPESLKHNFPLILAGHTGWKSTDLINRIKSLNGKENIRYIGFLNEAQKMSLLKGSYIFTYPSSYEGFGLPVLEAMACGKPCIVSQGTTISEFAKDSVLFFDAADTDELSSKIETLLTDQVIYNKLSVNAKRTAQEYSWINTAQKTLEIYQAI